TGPRRTARSPPVEQPHRRPLHTHGRAARSKDHDVGAQGVDHALSLSPYVSPILCSLDLSLVAARQVRPEGWQAVAQVDGAQAEHASQARLAPVLAALRGTLADDRLGCALGHPAADR